MKTIIKIIAAGILLAAIGCTQKTVEPPLVITKANCGNCHLLPPADSSHIVHVGWFSYKCSYCHQGYAMDSAANQFAVNTAVHRNGDTNVAFTAPWNDSGRASFNKASRQCSNVYCHGAIPQGTRASVHWNGTDKINQNCRACHNLDSTSAGIYGGHYGHTRNGSTVGGVPVRGSNVHYCFNCHGANISDTAYSVQLLRTDSQNHINGIFNAGNCRDCHAPDWTTWDEFLILNPGTPPHGKISVN